MRLGVLVSLVRAVKNMPRNMSFKLDMETNKDLVSIIQKSVKVDTASSFDNDEEWAEHMQIEEPKQQPKQPQAEAKKTATVPPTPTVGARPIPIGNYNFVLATGSNLAGQIGLGPQLTKSARFEPVYSLNKLHIHMIAGGSGHTIGLTSNGICYAAGKNEYGQLGNENKQSIYTFTKIFSLLGKTIIAVACGDMHTLVLTATGQVYGFGYNSQGQLGLGTKAHQYTPALITLPQGKKAKAIAAGGNHTLILSTDNHLYACGENDKGQLGLEEYREHPTLTEVTFFRGKKVKQLACGFSFSAVLLSNGELYTFGCNDKGELGIADKSEKSATPQRVFLPLAVAQVACGEAHSIALLENGQVFTFGRAKLDEERTPQQLTGIPANAVEVAAGAAHSVVLTSDGQVFTLGNNQSGELGTRDFKDKAKPEKVMFVESFEHENNIKIRAIFACGSSTFALY
jgi:alpha-tubulin suppressor-like RCC1 family protein